MGRFFWEKRKKQHHFPELKEKKPRQAIIGVFEADGDCHADLRRHSRPGIALPGADQC